MLRPSIAVSHIKVWLSLTECYTSTSHNDIYLQAISGVNESLAYYQLVNATEYKVVTDKGYASRSHVQCSYYGHGVTWYQMIRNLILAAYRFAVEWSFQKIKCRSWIATDLKNMKVDMKQVDYYVRSATLLASSHTCIHESQTGLRFRCAAPTLHEYFFLVTSVNPNLCVTILFRSKVIFFKNWLGQLMNASSTRH